MRKKKLSLKTRTAVLLSSAFCLGAMTMFIPMALAQQADAPPTPANSTPAVAAPTPTPTEEPPVTTLAAGLDIYSGISNIDGQKRVSDGYWATGSGVAYPSIAYLKLQNADGSAAKVAIGTGDMYRASGTTLNQPVEAWYQRPLGKYTVTAGKYWVPFALQEWQYETKYGVQLQRTAGATSYVGSVNYDHIKRGANAYFRAGHDFSANANAGLSLAAGDGLSYGSIHNKAVGLDLTAECNDFKSYSEFVSMQRRSSDRFNFFYTKLVYDKLPRLKPFVAYYKWNDRSGELGDFRSLAAGATYQLRHDLALEGGGANTRDKNIYWIQLHLTLEKEIWKDDPMKSPVMASLPGLHP